MAEINISNFQKRKKLNLKIKQEFQIWMLIRILGSSLLATVIAGLLSYLYAKNIIEADLLKFQAGTRTVMEVFLPVFLAASLTAIVSGLMAALILPQKIAGPIYRIEQDLKQVGSGDLTKTIKLRSGDILKDFAASVNISVADIGSLARDIKESAIELEKGINAGKHDDTNKALEDLKKKLERITFNQ